MLVRGAAPCGRSPRPGRGQLAHSHLAARPSHLQPPPRLHLHLRGGAGRGGPATGAVGPALLLRLRGEPPPVAAGPAAGGRGFAASSSCCARALGHREASPPGSPPRLQDEGRGPGRVGGFFLITNFFLNVRLTEKFREQYSELYAPHPGSPWLTFSHICLIIFL